MQAALKLKKYLKPYLLLAIIAPLMMILEVAMDLIQPTIMQHMIDNGIAKGDRPYVIQLFVSMVIAATLGLVGGIGCSIYSSRAAIHFATDIRHDLYEVITYLSNQKKDHFTLGKLITILTNDVEALQRALMMLLKVFVRGPLMFFGAIIFVFITARELFPVLVVIVPILVVAMYVFMKISGKLFLKVQQAIDQVNMKVQENLAGIRVIKAYNRKKHQMDQFTVVNELLTKRNITADQIVGVLMPLTMFIVNIGIVLGLWLGAIKVETGAVEVGVILAFINYLMMIMQGLTSSSNVLVQIARALPSAERVVSVLEEKKDITTVQHPIKTIIKGEVRFEQVSFSYIKNGEPVLKSISFHAKEGETVGIIGMTGSGKSTLVKLLSRLFDVDEGTIYIDGRPIQQYDLPVLRQSIGFAPQKATLFSTTIEENLKYGKEDASTVEVEEVLHLSRSMEFVEKLEKGKQQILSQGATNLSGGQKQRLAMARAFIRKPSILVLDDTTSAVDSISEKAIQQAIAKDFTTCTKFIVSSKISSIRNADLILVLDDGNVVAQGTHDELLKTSPIYKEMVAIQAQQGGNIYD